MSYTRGNDLALALRLADAADSITLARYQSIDLIVSTKPDNTPVTDADKASEEAIRALLKSHRPDDGIVGEEFGSDSAGADRYWVIDPIDGTKNFLRGVPTWATLIGLIERQSDGSEVVVVGVVSAPALFRRWYASEGNGAFVSVNKAAPEKISVSQISEIKYARAKLYLKEEWVIKNVPKMMDEVRQELYKYEEAPNILELEIEEKFKDKNGNIIEIEVRGERKYNNCYFHQLFNYYYYYYYYYYFYFIKSYEFKSL